MRRLVFLFIALFGLFLAPAAARADDPGGGSDKPVALADFSKGLVAQPGLFTLWRKDGKVYIELSPQQLDTDFIETAVPRNGIGGYFFFNGQTDFAPARLIRFSRVDDRVTITWPNTFFTAPPGSPSALAISQTFAPSLVDIAPIAATDATTGDVVFDASPFLADLLGVGNILKSSLGITDPENGYRLDPQRTFFGPSKAFPDNVLIEADQTFASDSPNVIDNVPDPRDIEIKVDYNIAQAPDNSDYMPRLADDRVGFFSNSHLEFGDDSGRNRELRYIIRWNQQPSDPTKAISPSKHPMVFYLSNTIPVEYRQAVRDALLTWNKAFVPLGISDAIQVKDQPDPSVDPTWDPDDIRYNVIRWLTESNSGGFAEAQLIYDPRTGQEFHTGVVIDADLMLFGNLGYPFEIQPAAMASTDKSFAGEEEAYAAGARAEASFGITALREMGLMSGYQVPDSFKYQFLKSIVLHESGHDMGFQHNFIGATAYTAKELQSKAFTEKYGVATSVMEYSPINLWPKGQSTGDYYATTIGPYDYYAIHWGYGRIPGAKTPQDEKPVLNRWASSWSDPMHRFASDEDVSWFNGHAIDPRVNHWIGSSDPLGWCNTRLQLAEQMIANAGHMYPRPGQEYEELRDATGFGLNEYATCADYPEHYIGGEYLSRAHAGDPGSTNPLVPVSRADEMRAWGMLDKYVFSDSAWNFSTNLLDRMTYSEWSPFDGGSWSYNPPPRHDVPFAEMAEGFQTQELQLMFQPLMLQRVDELSLKYRAGQTMSLVDLFSWTQNSVFGDLRGKSVGSIPLIHRSLQQSYVGLLSGLLIAPAPGTPFDAQALARAELTSLQGDLRHALATPGLDVMTQAHLADLQVRVGRALDARVTMPLGV
jgi:hypothetical protein